MERCSRASSPKTGQPAISYLAMKESGRRRAEHRDVEPGDVVGEHQGGLALARRGSALGDTEPEQPQEQPVEEHRHPGRDPPAPDAQAQRDAARRDEEDEGADQQAAIGPRRVIGGSGVAAADHASTAVMDSAEARLPSGRA